MPAQADDFETSEILNQTFDASTLEEAIFWRERMRTRLQTLIDGAAQPGGLTSSEVQLYRTAKLHVDIALAHLSLVNEERVD